MGETINLRRVRKDKARRDKDAQAAANRVLHGAPKAEREQARAQAALDHRRLDGHKRGE